MSEKRMLECYLVLYELGDGGDGVGRKERDVNEGKGEGRKEG